MPEMLQGAWRDKPMAISHAGDDRRRYPRSRRKLSLMVDDASPGVLNHIDNISANGVLCHTIKPVPLMTKLSMALELPSPISKRVECEGIVVRCEPDEKGDDHFKVAILYSRIDEDDRKAISEFVQESADYPPEADSARAPAH
jgi:hypothetical protein